MKLTGSSRWLSPLIMLLAGSALSISTQAADIVIDGNISDWTTQDRLELPPKHLFQVMSSQAAMKAVLTRYCYEI